MTLTIQRAAILGATGPTGYHLARSLRARGVTVRVVSRREDRLRALFPEDGTEHHAADLLDEAATLEAVEGCDLAVDCVGVPAAHMAEHPRTAERIARALEATGARGVQVSSFWSYLPLQRLPLDETHPREGGNGYIEARREAEDILHAAGAAVVHLPDFFGPRVHTATLQQALAEAAAGRPVQWMGGPDVEREYIYVPDAMELVADLATREEAYGERWLFPGAGPLSARRVASIAGAHLGREVKLRTAPPWLLRVLGLFLPPLRQFLPMVPHYVTPIRYDAGRLAALLGAAPSLTAYESAIGATLDWLLEQRR